jgi:uncharacterized membrane protein (UPF0127 family)
VLAAGALLLALASSTACVAPEPPAPGTPGIDLATPLPTFVPTATAVPSVAPANSPPPTAPGAASPLPTADVSLPQLVITNNAGSLLWLYVEIADTPEKQETGLMHRTALAADGGMLFVFPSETTIPFWMRDTLLPLSIAFIAGDGTIVDIQDMQPLDETLHNPAHPYVYALEVNQGYFRQHNVVVGNQVRLPALPTPPAPTLPPVPDASP